MWKPNDLLEGYRAYHCECYGYQRLFCQRSFDHRGNPLFPGLVANLIDDKTLIEYGWKSPEEPISTCHGIIYHVSHEHALNVLQELDYRERGGYIRHRISVLMHENTPFHSRGDVADAIVYTGKPFNPNYYLPKLQTPSDYTMTMIQLANIIAHAHGPSGSNAEYLLNLATFMKKSDMTDDRLEFLSELVHRKLNIISKEAYFTPFRIMEWGASEIQGDRFISPSGIDYFCRAEYHPIC